MRSASSLAGDLAIIHLPALATRLRKYDEELFELQLRHDDLEEEIARVRRGVAHKQAQQVRFAEQLKIGYTNKSGNGNKDADADAEYGVNAGVKRQRTQDNPDAETPTRSRLEERLDVESYDEPMEAFKGRSRKRKARFFSNEEMRAATGF